MKLGLAISIAIVLLATGVGFFTLRGVPDAPTARTSEKNLARRTLPPDLPVVFAPAAPEADATSKYYKALRLYTQNVSQFTSKEPPAELVREATVLLIEAADAGAVQAGFLDEQIPVYPGARPQFEDALVDLPVLVLEHSAEARRRGETEEALHAARAVWVLGQRAFEDNVRLYPRWQGLLIMSAAGEQLYPLREQVPDGQQKLSAWARAIQDQITIWQPKFELLYTVRPHVGDLVNMARHDQDMTFRVGAMLQLGVAKFNPGHRGNQRVIAATIDAGKQSDEPLVAQAAEAADRFSIEEMRKLR